MAYTPTITTEDEDVTIESTGTVTYQEIVQMLGSGINFMVLTIYLAADSFNQIMEPVLFKFFETNGYFSNEVIVPSPDPYQSSKSIFLNVSKQNVLLDGFSSFNFNLLANEQVTMILRVKEVFNSDELNKYHRPNKYLAQSV